MNELGKKNGSSSGYVDLGTDFSPLPGVQLEGGSKVVCGASASRDNDVISTGELQSGHYYWKIALNVKDVKKPVSNTTFPQKLALSTQGTDIDLTAKEVPNLYKKDINNAISGFYIPAISTVKSLSMVRVDSKGKQQPVNANSVEWIGSITLDGTIDMQPGVGTSYSLLNFTLPQSREWLFNAENVALGSSFGNLRLGDKVQSAPGAMLLRSGTSFVRYIANTAYIAATDTQEFRYKYVSAHKDAGLNIATVAMDASGNLGMYGLDSPGKELTVISNYHYPTSSHTFGRTVDTYKVIMGNNPYKGYKSLLLQHTNTASNGLRTVRYSTDFYSNPNLNLSKLDFGDVITSESYVDSTFDWTYKQNNTGYFAVSKDAATAKAGHTIIKSKDAANKYIAVSLSTDATIYKIQQVQFQPSTGTIVETSSQFSGRLSLSLGGHGLHFDRSSALSAKSIAAAANISISGAGSLSSIANLHDGDTVSTITLSKDNSLAVGGMNFFAASKSQLFFKMQGGTITATKGSFSLNPQDELFLHGQLNIYDGKSVVPIRARNGVITVTVGTNNKGVTSYTISNLQINSKFSIGDVVYRKTQNNLFRIVNDEVTGVYALGSKTSVSSAVLASVFKPVADTFTKDATTSPYGLPTVSLTSFDTRWRQLAKTYSALSSYDAVVDSYVAATTTQNAKAKMAAYFVGGASAQQTVIGKLEPSLLITENTPSYTATANVAQSIQAANGWHVTGSDGNDTITGAVKGVDYIRGGKGDDTIVLGKASDVVSFNLGTDGNNVVKGYTAKDEIVLDGGNDFTVDLDTKGANVFLRKGDGSVQLVGMGKAQSVLINGNKYHFGNGTLAKNKTQTTAGTNFAYDSGAHYYGNDSGKNTLTISKAASKEATAERLTIDFSNNDNKGTSLYYNIDTVNANASAKGVDFTAGSRNSKFIGSAYDDTITCGGGRDYISCAPGKGNDTISNFAVNDVLQLNGLTKESIEAISAYNGSGSLVLTAKSGKLTSTITLNNIKASTLTYNAKAKTVTGA